MCSYGRGFIWKYDQREGLTCRRAKGGGALYRIEERGRGFWQSCHPLPPSLTKNRGVAGEPLRRPIPAGRGSAAARVRGERERRRGRLDSPTWLELRWSEAAGRREPAAVSGDGCGGGATG